jgi:hypothetical protein
MGRAFFTSGYTQYPGNVSIHTSLVVAVLLNTKFI